MLIFIDSNYNIKAIDNSDDESLTCIEVDREKVFDGFSDFMILHYKYIPHDHGYYIRPSINYDELLYLESKEAIKSSQNQISSLGKAFEKGQTSQNEIIIVNMLAITEMYELANSNMRTMSEEIVPTNIQEVYQRLFDLGIKDLSEIPYQVRKKLKAK